MANILDFRRDVHLYIAQVPDVVIDRTTYRVLNDFLTRSEVYRDEITPAAYTISTATLDLAAQAPAGTRVTKVVDLRWLNSEPDERIPFATKQQLSIYRPDWQSATGTKPEYWTLDNPTTVRFYPIASATVASSIGATIALTLTESTTTVPDWIYNRYAEWILPGIYSRLFLMPQREWSDPNLGASFAQLYEENVKKAMVESTADQGRPVRATSYGGI